jgi:hypothetical protein
MKQLFALVLAACSLQATAVDRIVEEFGVPPTFPSIAAAITAANDGDFNSALEAMRGGGIPAPVIAGPNVLWLRARDANNNWGPSFGIVVNIDTTITGTVAVPEFHDKRSVVLLPNPAAGGDGFTVRLSSAVGEVRVLLVDGGGRLVAEHHYLGGTELRMPLGALAHGMYHVGILPRDGAATWRKLLVH